MDFVQHLDMGVPLDIPTTGDEDVLIVYNQEEIIPQNIKPSSDSSLAVVAADDAIAQCDYLNILLTDHSSSRKQCIAIVPQYESYHVQKWMRVEKNIEKGTYGPLNSDEPLRMVSRGYQANGRDQFAPPLDKHIQQNWELLEKYFASYQDSLKELKPLVEKVADKDRTVTVMVCNFGQSELLVNFVCSAKSRQLDISTILVFTTDLETKELAEQLGLTAFYDQRVRIHIPKAKMKSLRISIIDVTTQCYFFVFVVCCCPELRRYAIGSCREIRGSQVYSHDDGQGHLCTNGQCPPIQFTVSRCRHCMV